MTSRPSLAVRFGPDVFCLFAGGVRRYAAELIGALRSSDVDVRLPGGVDSNDFSARSSRPAGARVVAQAREVVALRREAPRTVFHSLYYDPAYTLIKRPVVVSVHDMIHEHQGMGRGLQIVKSRAMRHADVLVAASQFSADSVREFVKDPPRIAVVPHGLSTSMQRTPAARHDLASRGPFVLYVGWRGGYKNFEILLEAFPQLRNLSLNLVCAGGEAPSPTEVDAARAAVGKDREVFFVRPTDAELAALYDSATVFVVTSREEGFGLPVLEAMARGCAVASSTAGSLSEVCGPWAHMFEPSSSENCASAVRSAVMASPSAKAQAAHYARGFTWQLAAERHIEIYRSLLESR